MRLHGRETRPANAAAVEMLDEAGRACPGIELASIRVEGQLRRAGRNLESRMSASASRSIRISRSTASIRRRYGENGKRTVFLGP
jgi:hypothetical protein